MMYFKLSIEIHKPSDIAKFEVIMSVEGYMRFKALHVALILGVKVVIVVTKAQVVWLICQPSALGLGVYISGRPLDTHACVIYNY